MKKWSSQRKNSRQQGDLDRRPYLSSHLCLQSFQSTVFKLRDIFSQGIRAQVLSLDLTIPGFASQIFSRLEALISFPSVRTTSRGRPPTATARPARLTWMGKSRNSKVGVNCFNYLTFKTFTFLVLMNVFQMVIYAKRSYQDT